MFGVPATLGGVFDEPGGGVAEEGAPITGDPLRPFDIDLRTSWKGSIDDGCATLLLTPFFPVPDLPGRGSGAFLKLGSFGFALGAEKNDESDLASFVGGVLVNSEEASFLTAMGFVDVAEPTAGFLDSGGALIGASSFRFFGLISRMYVFSGKSVIYIGTVE